MFFMFFYIGIVCISVDYVFIIVQQFVDLGYVCDVGCSDYYVVYKFGFIVDINVSFGIEVILVVFFGLMYFWVVFVVFVFG